MNQNMQNISSHLSMTRELVEFLWHRGFWWLIPVMVLWAFLPLTMILFLFALLRIIWSRTQPMRDKVIYQDLYS